MLNGMWVLPRVPAMVVRTGRRHRHRLVNRRLLHVPGGRRFRRTVHARCLRALRILRSRAADPAGIPGPYALRHERRPGQPGILRCGETVMLSRFSIRRAARLAHPTRITIAEPGQSVRLVPHHWHRRPGPDTRSAELDRA